MSHNYFLPLYSIPGIIAGMLTYHATLFGIPFFICTTIIACMLPQRTAATQLLRRILLIAGWYCIGIAAAWYEMRPFEQLYTQHKITMAVTGTVTDYIYCRHIRYPHRITLTIDAQDTMPACSLYLYTNHKTTTAPYAIDDRLTISNLTLKKPDTSFSRYLIKEDIMGTAFVAHDAIHCTPARQRSWHAWFYALRATLFERIQKQLSPDHFALFSALFLGNKIYDKDETDPIQTQFRIWGIAHIFARSGMHISMIIGILLYLLTLVPLPYSLKIISTSFIGIVYALCSWSTISFIRALSMFLMSNYCILMRRQHATMHILGITTIAVLLWHPLNLFFLDFQLSFALTGALVWICGIVAKQ